MTLEATRDAPSSAGRRAVPGSAIWVPGLLVAGGAAVATAHGLYEVAVADRVPAPIAWLYPLMTDGLALVAYAATASLTASARRYAWLVVVLAAGLSGLAQASHLAGDGELAAPAPLRFAIGAWPAVAAAIAAHLVYLLLDGVHRPAPVEHRGVQPFNPGTPVPSAVQPALNAEHPPSATAAGAPSAAQAGGDDALPRTRAQAAAQRHLARHGELPTVSTLMRLADVSRGTAGHALKAIRARPHPLHIVHPDEPRTTP